MRTWKGLVNKSKTKGNDMFTAKPSQPALTSLSLKLNRTSKEKKPTKQNQQKKYNVLLEIERRRCYVTLPW